MIINPYTFGTALPGGKIGWRVLVGSSNSSPNYGSMQELAMFVNSDGSGTDECFGSGGIPFASSYFRGFFPSLAFNGDYTSTVPPECWASNGTSSDLYPFLGFIFPTSKDINAIKICARHATPAQSPNTFLIQSSIDTTTGLDGTWLNEWMVSSQISWTAGEIRAFLRTSFLYDVWNARVAGPQTAISNNFRTMVRTGSGYVNNQATRSTRSHSTGKYYIEVSCGKDNNGGSSEVGLCNDGVGALGAAPTFWISLKSSAGGGGTGLATYVTSVQTKMVPNRNAADDLVVGMAVDFDAGKAWYRIESAAGWIYGTTVGGGSDPTTGNNPTFTFTPNTRLWAWASSPYQLTECTFNSGASYLYAPPSGFGTW